MDFQYLQAQRFQLQKRVRLNSCDATLFHSALVQFWNYLHEHVLFKAVLEKLATEAPDHATEIQALKNRNIALFTSEKAALRFAFRVIEHCAAQPVEANGQP